MSKQKLFLTFDSSAKESPILSSLTGRFGLVFNIFGATMNDNTQFIALELEGEESQIQQAMAFLEDVGVQVEKRND